jgi:hypothetical protein
MKLFELASTAEVTELERHLDKMMATLGLDVEFTRHFIERLLGRERNITVDDITQSFEQLKRKYKSRLLKAKKTPNYNAVLRDFDQDLNIVFGIKPVDGGHELINITIKKKDPSTFVTNRDGGDDLKVGSKRVNEFQLISDLRGLDSMQTAQDQEEASQAANDFQNNRAAKFLPRDRGENYKKAKRLARNAKTGARATNKEKKPTPDQEVIQGADDTPHTTQGNVSNWRMQ